MATGGGDLKIMFQGKKTNAAAVVAQSVKDKNNSAKGVDADAQLAKDKNNAQTVNNSAKGVDADAQPVKDKNSSAKGVSADN